MLLASSKLAREDDGQWIRRLVWIGLGYLDVALRIVLIGKLLKLVIVLALPCMALKEFPLEDTEIRTQIRTRGQPARAARARAEGRRRSSPAVVVLV